jgi:hypothetical protein
MPVLGCEYFLLILPLLNHSQLHIPFLQVTHRLFITLTLFLFLAFACLSSMGSELIVLSNQSKSRCCRHRGRSVCKFAVKNLCDSWSKFQVESMELDMDIPYKTESVSALHTNERCERTK